MSATDREGGGDTSGALSRWLTLVAVAALVALALLEPLDRAGLDRTDTAIKRALAAYAVARAINSAISFAQGTEIAIQPAGLGVTLTPGELLDPVNDLVERFSWVMLMSSVSLGVQKVLVSAGMTPLLSGITVALLILWLAVQWLAPRHGRDSPGPAREGPGWRDWLRRAVVVVVLLRFAVPVYALASEALYDAFLGEQYREATERLELTRGELSRLSEKPLGAAQEQAEGPSVWERVRRAVDLGAASDAAKARMRQLADAAGRATTTLVDLAVVFVLQTALFPLAFLWLLLYALRSALAARV